MKKIINLLTVPFFALLLLMGCSSNEDSLNKPGLADPMDTLVGTWVRTRYEYVNTSTVTFSHQPSPRPDMPKTMTITTDGLMVYSYFAPVDNEAAVGQVRFVNDLLDFDLAAPFTQQAFNYILTEDALLLKDKNRVFDFDLDGRDENATLIVTYERLESMN